MSQSNENVQDLPENPPLLVKPEKLAQFMSNIKQKSLVTKSLAKCATGCHRQCKHKKHTIKINAEMVKHGLTITCPGKYVVCESLVFCPSNSQLVAITINCSNVFLDFNTFSLTQKNTDVAETVGVVISDNVQNVSIVNGSISNFSLVGVYGHKGCKNVLLENLLIEKCGYNGQSLTRYSNFFGANEYYSGGIVFLGDESNLCTQIRLNNVSSNEHYNTVDQGINLLKYMGGCSIAHAMDIVIENSQFNRNENRVGIRIFDPYTEYITVGVYITNASNITMTNIETNNNIGLGVACIIVGEASNLYVSKHIANDNISFGWTVGNFPFPVNGCLIEDSFYNRNITLPDPNISAELGGTSGIFMTGDGMRVSNCTMTKSRTGVAVYDSNNISVENCFVQNGVSENLPDGVTRGIEFYNTNFGVIKNNSVLSMGGPFAGVGIRLLFSTQIDVLDNTIIKSEGALYGQGIRIGSESSAIKVIGNNVQKHNDGIALLNQGISNIMIKDNQISDNVVNGLLILAPPNNFAVLGNTASLNGTNYVGLPVGTPVRTWVLNTSPPPVNDSLNPTSSLDNLSIKPQL